MSDKELLMTAEDVTDLYRELEGAGIRIWVDGGWSVDALLGRQLRPHRDLDIALEWRDVPPLRNLLARRGYRQVRDEGQWNLVLADSAGHEVDVHAFVCDENGTIVEGCMYPAGALTGTGVIAGHDVRCIAPHHMVAFLAPWIGKWPEKYVPAVAALCETFRIELPREYLRFKDGSRSRLEPYWPGDR